MLDRPMPSKKKPDSIDIEVGSRIRLRRVSIGMSQEQLGEKLGITFQQIQKYEKGANRVGASRMSCIAKALGVPVSFFFGEQADAGTPASQSENDILRYLGTAEGVALNRAFSKISNPKTRRRLVELARALGGTEHEPLAA